MVFNFIDNIRRLLYLDTSKPVSNKVEKLLFGFVKLGLHKNDKITTLIGSAPFSKKWCSQFNTTTRSSSDLGPFHNSSKCWECDVRDWVKLGLCKTHVPSVVCVDFLKLVCKICSVTCWHPILISSLAFTSAYHHSSHASATANHVTFCFWSLSCLFYCVIKI